MPGGFGPLSPASCSIPELRSQPAPEGGKHADFLGFSSLSNVYRAHSSLLVEGQVWLSPQQGLLADELKFLWGNQLGEKTHSAKTPPVCPSWTRSCSDLVQTWPGVGSEEGEDVTHIWDVATEDRWVSLLSSPSAALSQ